MDKLSRLTAEDRQNLTAYLDGELDEVSTRRIESILTNSEVARSDVDALSRTYDLLNVLPRPRASNEFVEKTMASARLAGFRKPVSQQIWFQRTKHGVILASWTLALLLASVCGYALTSRLIQQDDDRIIDKLPLLQNLDTYSEVGQVQFLEKLSSEKKLLEDIRGGTQE